MSDDVLVSTEDGIATVTLNRPDQRNAMNRGMWQALGSIWTELNEDPGVRAVVLTGAGEDAFSAGADIKEFDQHRDNSAKARSWSGAVDAAMLNLGRMTKPTVALIKGYCVGGGCELAAFCDIRIAAENAQFGVPAARLGISIGYEEMQRLIQLVGLGNTSYILLSARLLDAQEALRIGLVNQVAPLAEIDEYTSKLVKGMTTLAPMALQDNKDIIRTVLANPSLEGMTPEQEALPYRVFDSADFAEGRRAFVEKRRPQFQGR